MARRVAAIRNRIVGRGFNQLIGSGDPTSHPIPPERRRRDIGRARP
jgi:hypothetical protein